MLVCQTSVLRRSLLITTFAVFFCVLLFYSIGMISQNDGTTSRILPWPNSDRELPTEQLFYQGIKDLSNGHETDVDDEIGA